MASQNLGTLTLSLIAKVGGYTAGMDAAGRSAEKNAKKSMEAWREAGDQLNSFVRVGAAGFAALAGAGATAFAAIKSQADALDAFNDIKDATGASIEGISALDRVARETGSNIDAVESILVKFNATLKEAKPGDDSDRLFKSLNLNIKELKGLDPAEALRRTAVAFGQFESDGNKARAMQEIFGKSVKEAAPFLNDLAEKTTLVGTTSTQTAAQAEVFNKQLFELKANSQDAARAFTADLLPALNTFLQNYKDLKAQGSFGLIVKDAAKDVFGLGKLTGDNAADIKKFMKERDELQAAMDKETRPLVRANDSRKEQIAELNQYLALVRTKQRNEIFAQNIGVDYGDAISRKMQPRRLPETPPKPAKGAKDNSAAQEAAAQLGFDLDAIKNAQEAFQNAYANNEKILEAMRSAGLTEETDYYKQKKALLDSNTASQVAAQEQTIARLQQEDLAGKAGIDNQKKIADAQAALAKIRENAAAQAKVLGIEEESAFTKIKNALLSARQAAQDYFDTTARGYQRDLEGIGQGSKFREMQSAISQIEDRYQQARQDLQNQRSQAELAGSFGPQAAKQYEAQLAIINEFQSKAIDSYKSYYETLNTAQKDWLNGATEALANYSTEAANVAKHTEEAFTNAFKGLEDQLTNLLTGKKFDAKGLLASISADLARNAVKEGVTGPLAGWMKEMFGGEGGLGALLGLGKGAGAAGSAASMAALTASTTGASSALAALTAAASSASVALGGSAGGNGLGSVLGLFGGSGGGTADVLGDFIKLNGFASGGYTGNGSPNDPAGIVHKGEYVLTAEQTKRIGVGNLDRGNFGGGSGRGFTVNNNFTLNAPADRRTQSQIAAEAGRSIRSAQIRLG
jgi:lambda family phage tail tape measure protein